MTPTKHTLTFRLTEAAQRQALLDGQPAECNQTFVLEPELFARVFALPWTIVTAAGFILCDAPNGGYVGKYIGDKGSWSSGSSQPVVSLAFDVRPETVAEAVAIYEAKVQELADRNAVLDVQRAKEAEEKAQVEAEREEGRQLVKVALATLVQVPEVRDALVEYALGDMNKPHTLKAVELVAARLGTEVAVLKAAMDRGYDWSKWHDAVHELVKAPLAEAQAAKAEAQEAKARDEKAAEAALLAKLVDAEDLARYAAGFMGAEEIKKIIRNYLFAPITGEAYVKLERADIDHGEDCYRDQAVQFTAEDEHHLSRAQFAQFLAMQAEAACVAQLPDVTNVKLTPRWHQATCPCDSEVTTRYSVRVGLEWRGQKFSRELGLCDAD